MFMDTRIEVVCDEQGVAGFWITWKFDKVFTASILMDFDRDKDRKLSRDEIVDIENRAFSNLVNYNYFVYIHSSKGLFRPSSVEQFSAYLEDERVHYRFFVPYPLVIWDPEVTVSIAVYDETFFCDIGYAERGPVLFPASDVFSGTYSIREDRGIHIDYVANDGSRSSTFPRQVVLTLQREL
jgi:ABC-type uncharacterized transport system substrate-binding protein